jgi:hypothetical protein
VEGKGGGEERGGWGEERRGEKEGEEENREEMVEEGEAGSAKGRVHRKGFYK